MYYNTTNETGATLDKSKSKARSQDDMVLDYFKKHEMLGATPERVLRHFKIMEGLNENRWYNTPITSIRRSFSNLHKMGLIRKKKYKVQGDFGKHIHVWELVTND